MENTHRNEITFRLSSEQLEKIKDKSEELGLKPSWFCKLAVFEKLKEMSEEDSSKN
jgi:predicted DNA binding CopG/RHH family protein